MTSGKKRLGSSLDRSDSFGPETSRRTSLRGLPAWFEVRSFAAQISSGVSFVFGALEGGLSSRKRRRLLRGSMCRGRKTTGKYRVSGSACGSCRRTMFERARKIAAGSAAPARELGRCFRGGPMARYAWTEFHASAADIVRTFRSSDSTRSRWSRAGAGVACARLLWAAAFTGRIGLRLRGGGTVCAVTVGGRLRESPAGRARFCGPSSEGGVGRGWLGGGEVESVDITRRQCGALERHFAQKSCGWTHQPRSPYSDPPPRPSTLQAPVLANRYPQARE